MRLYLSVVALVVTIAGMCGCGSSSNAGSSSPASTGPGATSTETSPSATGAASTPPGSGSALSKSELLAQADAICGRLNTELDSPVYTINNPAKIVHLAPQRAAAEQAAASALGKLAPPVSMAPAYEELLKARQVPIEELTKLGEDEARHDIAAARAIFGSSTATLHKIATMAEHDGFKQCGSLG